jgi:hypothetical protein
MRGSKARSYLNRYLRPVGLGNERVRNGDSNASDLVSTVCEKWECKIESFEEGILRCADYGRGLKRTSNSQKSLSKQPSEL